MKLHKQDSAFMGILFYTGLDACFNNLGLPYSRLSLLRGPIGTKGDQGIPAPVGPKGTTGEDV